MAEELDKICNGEMLKWVKLKLTLALALAPTLSKIESRLYTCKIW